MTPAKCPNPECSFRFDPARVPPGATIACPSCGRRFTLAQAVAPEPDAEPDFGFTPPPRPASKPRKSNRTAAALAGVSVVVVAAVGVVVAALLLKRPEADPSAALPEFRKADLNFAVRTPPAGWAADPVAQTTLTANVFAYRRTGPDAWAALAARDYGGAAPRPSELRDKVLNQLAAGFDHVPTELAATAVEWAGHPAERFPFRGVYRPTGETCVGDCLVLSHQGIAYWFYAWCPEAVDATAEIAAVRDGFRTLGLRDKWKQTAVAGQTFRGRSVAYQLADPDRIWAKPAKQPTDEDPRADLLLDAALKSRERGDQRPRAEVVVMVLDPTDDPLAAGRAYVEKRHRARHADAGNPAEVTELTDEPVGDPPGDAAGPLLPAVRLKLTVGDADSFRSADKLLVLAAAAVGGKTVIAEASCPWKERAVWERRLMQFVGSLSAAR